VIIDRFGGCGAGPSWIATAPPAPVCSWCALGVQQECSLTSQPPFRLVSMVSAADSVAEEMYPAALADALSRHDIDAYGAPICAWSAHPTPKSRGGGSRRTPCAHRKRR
jgi:hypothetical protein